MGGRGRKRTQRKHFKETRENVWKYDSKSDDPAAVGNSGDSQAANKSGWEPFANQNPAFEEYYKEQRIVDAQEWDTFMEFLRKPLPAAFRINSSGQFCLDIRSQLEDDFAKSLQSEFTGEDEAEALRPLPWYYPKDFAWHSNFSRNQLRKNQTLVRFHEFLKLGNEIGNITRQEAVSMVPPLFLDVHSDHYVLDMCAAPGSKTFQLLEIIHRSNQPGSLPSGMIVANDVDVQRSNLLIHQMKRMCTANLIVTNHEAQDFPGCRLNKFHHRSSDLVLTKDLTINQLLFDRVLCDVPCSGDGTLRKAPDIWKKWGVGMGNGVHSLQIKIALRGISLLTVGGRMVYSTCSMNPVENEAVVAEILRKCGDSVELLDVSKDFPQLKRRPGLKQWKVRDKSIWLSSYNDVPEDRRVAFPSSMFSSAGNAVRSSEISGNRDMAEAPNNGGDVEAEPVAPPMNNAASPTEVNNDNVCSFPLERCMRIVPHDQNTGAFFVAVFHKRSPFPVFQEQTTGVNGCFPCKDEQHDEASRDKIAENAGKLDADLEAKSNNSTPVTAHVVGKETDETSLGKNEAGGTLKDDVLEGQQELGCNNESGPEKVGTKRKLPRESCNNESAHVVGKETEETSLGKNEASGTLKDDVLEGQQELGCNNESGPEKVGTKRKLPRESCNDESAHVVGKETEETSLGKNEAGGTLKDDVLEGQQELGCTNESGPEKVGTKRKLPRESCNNESAHVVGKETEETSLGKNEAGGTLEDDVLEGQQELGCTNESGPEKVGTKRKLPRESCNNESAHVVGKETEETSLGKNEASGTLKDDVLEGQQELGCNNESGPEKVGTKRKLPRESCNDESAHVVGKETEETSLGKNEAGGTLKDDVLEGQQELGCTNESGPEKIGKKRKLPSHGKWRGVDPVILFKDEIVISNIKTFYGVDDSFPLFGHLVSRNSDTDSVKRIYYISKSVKDVLELNFLAGQQLKMASVGLKMFERQTSKDGNSSPCRFRISSEGLPLLLPHITKQIVFAPFSDFKHLLQYKFIKFGDFVDSELGERASKLELGCFVVVLSEVGQPSSVPLRVDSSTIAIGCWKGRNNLNVMMAALDCTDLLARLEKRYKSSMHEDDVDIDQGGTNDPDVKEDTEAAPKRQKCS